MLLSTALTIAVERGAHVFPFRFRDKTAEAHATSLGAVLASKERGSGSPSLSPTSLLCLTSGTRLVLPSPNGSTLSVLAGTTPTFAGCLRNAAAVARAAGQIGKTIAIIPAGERWPDGTLRPALEDELAAGAIIHHLAGSKSPEARGAESVFRDALSRGVREAVADSLSGRELIARGFEEDVRLAAAIDASEVVPVLRDGAYEPFAAGSPASS